MKDDLFRYWDNRVLDKYVERSARMEKARARHRRKAVRDGTWEPKPRKKHSEGAVRMKAAAWYRRERYRNE